VNLGTGYWDLRPETCNLRPGTCDWHRSSGSGNRKIPSRTSHIDNVVRDKGGRYHTFVVCPTYPASGQLSARGTGGERPAEIRDGEHCVLVGCSTESHCL